MSQNYSANRHGYRMLSQRRRQCIVSPSRLWYHSDVLDGLDIAPALGQLSRVCGTQAVCRIKITSQGKHTACVADIDMYGCRPTISWRVYPGPWYNVYFHPLSTKSSESQRRGTPQRNFLVCL